MRTCFVPYCDVKNKNQPNRTMFLPPKEPNLFAQWSEALPKVRKLKATDKVCYLHFRPDDVLYTFDHCINGQIIKIKRDRPRLKPAAIPCLEMTTNEEWLSHRAKNPKINANTEQMFELNSKEPEEVNNAQNMFIEVERAEEEEKQNEITSSIVNMENKDSDREGDEQKETEMFELEIENILAEETNYDCNKKLSAATNDIKSVDLTETELSNLFNLLYENVNEVLMPNTLWGIHRCPEGSFVCFSYMDAHTMLVTKMCIIKDDGLVELLLDGNVIKTLQLLHDIDGLDSLSIVLNKMDVGRLCLGKSTNTNCDIIVEPNNENCWFDDDNDEEVYVCKYCLPEN